jgi:hypothetical protein
MKQKLLYTLMFSSVLGLQACGGGGGSGGPSYMAPTTTNTRVPFSTPQKVSQFTPLSTTTYNYAIENAYAADLKNNGTQNVVIAGAESSSADSATNWHNNVLSVYGWTNGNFVDQTSQWFAPGDNVILGAQNVKFGNFNGSGYSSMFVTPNTDGNTNITQAQIFTNNGSTFTRNNINFGYSIWATDSTLFNYNGLSAVAITEYGPNGTFIFGSNTNNFRAYSVNNSAFGGSAIAAGDFFNNGTTSFMVTDTYGNGIYKNQLFTWAFNGNTVSVTPAGLLPLARFDLPMYDAVFGGPVDPAGQGRSHSIAALAWNFDTNGAANSLFGGTNLIVVTRPTKAGNGAWPSGSEVQFLQNNGHGQFTDVTGQYLVGYDTSKAASYTPYIMDLTGSGLMDIILPAQNGTQILMQTADHKFVASYANVLTDFQNQVKSIQGSSTDSDNGGTVTFVKGPNGNLYLLELLSVNPTNHLSQKAIYLSQIGTPGSISASSTISTIKQMWPYLSDASANAVLAATGKTWFGGTIIDPDSALNPIGGLGINTSRGMSSINGYIAGVNFGADTTVTATDSLNRSFNVNLQPLIQQQAQNAFNMDSEHIDQHELTSHTEYLVNGPINNYGPVRGGVETRNMYNTVGSDVRVGPTLNTVKNYTVGIPRLWSNGNWSVGAQYTTLNYNPWLAFGGAWGMVTQTGNLDTTVRYNHSNGFTAVAGTTYTTTQLMPGLVSKVNDIYGAWAEAGYKLGNFGMYAGVKPVVVSGSIQANLPTGIDNAGNMQYTGRSLAIQNQTTGYARALWTTDLNKHTAYRVSGTAMTNGQYRLMNELRFSFD